MSRFDGDDYEPIVGRDGKVKETSGLWRANVARALAGRRGQEALRELRTALEALPEHRLIEGALCTVRLQERIDSLPLTKTIEMEPIQYGPDGRPLRDAAGNVVRWPLQPTVIENYDRKTLIEFAQEHEGEPEGVCLVGAFAWYRKIQAGLAPDDAFATLEVLPDNETGWWDTASAGEEAGLSHVLAIEFAYLNDERWGGLTPEARYSAAVAWIDKHLARVEVEA